MQLVSTIFTVAFLLVLSCSTGKEEDKTSKDAVSSLLGINTTYSPVIYSVDPKIGNPAFAASGLTFPATKVTINGKNFDPSLIGNIVRFNKVNAAVEYADAKKIIAVVPDGSTTGILSITSLGGSCNSPDGRSGWNCATSDFYVNCYSPYQSKYGAENEISSGSSATISFTEAAQPKAFRSDLLPGQNNILIGCLSLVQVVYFGTDCRAITHQVGGATYLLSPIINITGPYTVQYQITAGKGDCTIKVN